MDKVDRLRCLVIVKCYDDDESLTTSVCHTVMSQWALRFKINGKVRLDGGSCMKNSSVKGVGKTWKTHPLNGNGNMTIFILCLQMLHLTKIHSIDVPQVGQWLS